MQVQPPVKDENLQSIAPVAKCLATDVSQGHPYASTEAGPYSTCRYFIMAWVTLFNERLYQGPGLDDTVITDILLLSCGLTIRQTSYQVVS